MWNRRILIIWTVFLEVTFLIAQSPAQVLSLKDCVQYAFENNHKVKKASLEIEKVDFQLQEMKSQGLPQVNLQSDLQYFPQVPTNILTGAFVTDTEKAVETQLGRSINFNTGLEFSQLVYKKGKSLGKDAHEQLHQINQLQLSKTQEELGFEIAKLYYQAQIIERQKGILKANLDQINGLLTVLQKQYDNGFIKKIDLDQLKVKKSNLESKQYQLELQYDKLLKVLKYQMAMPLENTIALSDTLTEQNYLLPSPIIDSFKIQNQTLLNLFDSQLAINHIQTENLKAGNYPSVYFRGAYNLQAIADGFGGLGQSGTWFHYGFLGFQLRQSIFDGNKRKAQIAQKNIESQQIQEDRAFVESSLELQYHNARQAIQTNLSNLESLDETRKVAEEVYTVAQKRYSEGIAPITELLSAETARQEAQTNYLTALLQLKLAELELQYVTGTLLDQLLQ